MRKLLRQPLLHFVLLGGALWFVERQWQMPEAAEAPAPITIAQSDIERLRADWRRETGRLPTEAQLSASIEHHVDDELLMAEALRLDLDQSDPIARDRLLRNMQFAFPDRRASAATLLAEARTMGMSHSDLIVRRRLVQVMERRLVAAVPFDSAAFEQYLDAHRERYEQSARTQFRQVFFADATERASIDRALARLQNESADPAALGDSFLHGGEFPPLSAAEIERRFGADFSSALNDLPQGRWVGPLRSAYGWHLVEVQQRVVAAAPAEQSRSQALRAWLAAQQPRVLRAALAQLREQYEVKHSNPVSLSPDAGGEGQGEGQVVERAMVSGSAPLTPTISPTRALVARAPHRGEREQKHARGGT